MRAARVDDNQDEIKNALRDIGASVFVTSNVGNGFGDLVVGFRGVNYLLEIKDGSKPPSRRKLTPAEAKFHDEWRGQVDVVNSVDEALQVVGAI